MATPRAVNGANPNVGTNSGLVVNVNSAAAPTTAATSKFGTIATTMLPCSVKVLFHSVGAGQTIIAWELARRQVVAS